MYGQVSMCTFLMKYCLSPVFHNIFLPTDQSNVNANVCKIGHKSFLPKLKPFLSVENRLLNICVGVHQINL